MKVEVILEPAVMRVRSRAARAAGKTVGLVPTMGYLHEGHLSLIQKARAECSVTVVSIFVNPSQFGPQEDFARYPRDLDRDRALVERAEADIIFHPDAGALYPDGAAALRTWVTVEGMSDVLCGGSRPGHFRGVATVVTKLFNIVEPDAAYFGQKDAQQAIIIKRMAKDLDSGVRIEICPTVREEDGLAMSSRNKYLGPAERPAAAVIHRALSSAAAAARAGEWSPRRLVEAARAVLEKEPLFTTEYVELVDATSLSSVSASEGPLPRESLLAVAGRIGQTRLIDNVIITTDD